MNPNLENQIQQLGALRQQRKAIEVAEQKLYRSVVGQMSEHGMDKSMSSDYTASLIRQQKLTVKPAAFAKLVTKKELLESVSVSVTQARKFLGEKKLLKVSDVSESLQLRISAKKVPASSDAPAVETDALSL